MCLGPASLKVGDVRTVSPHSSLHLDKTENLTPLSQTYFSKLLLR